MPRPAAAPFGRPTTQPVSRKAPRWSHVLQQQLQAVHAQGQVFPVPTGDVAGRQDGPLGREAAAEAGRPAWRSPSRPRARNRAQARGPRPRPPSGGRSAPASRGSAPAGPRRRSRGTPGPAARRPAPPRPGPPAPGPGRGRSACRPGTARPSRSATGGAARRSSAGPGPAGVRPAGAPPRRGGSGRRPGPRPGPAAAARSPPTGSPVSGLPLQRGDDLCRLAGAGAVPRQVAAVADNRAGGGATQGQDAVAGRGR
jgi:hypothetical protein